MSDLIFNIDNISLKNDPSIFVMMEWERELMRKHAEIVTKNGGDILEIGFGMGISATYIQEFGVNSHTIVEYHPEVFKKLLDWSLDKSNVIPILGDWSIMSPVIKKRKYDGIFYDPHYFEPPLFSFKDLVEKVIKNGGVFSYFSACGADSFSYLDRLILEEITIDNIPNNTYHNDNLCKVPYVVY